MAIIAVYQYRARFRSHSDPTDAPPAVGLSRQGMLMLQQETAVRSNADAIAACLSHGAFDAVIGDFGVLDLALLAKPQNEDLRPLYQWALQNGSAIGYDPNSAPDSEALVVAQWGFRPQGG